MAQDGVNIPGATNDTLTITNVQVADGGSYSVVVANIVAAFPAIRCAGGGSGFASPARG